MHHSSQPTLGFGPLLTCWPVLTEAAWLLRDEPGGYKALGGLIESGLVELAELDATALAWVIAFMNRYTSAKAQMADAALRKGPPTFWHPGIVGGPFRSHGPKPRGSHGGRRHAGVDGSVNSSFLHFSLPHARPVPVKSWSWTSWFGQWSPDPPGLCDRGSPSPRPSARHLETYGRPNGGVRRPRRTKQIRNESSRDQRAVKTNFAACQCDTATGSKKKGGNLA